MARLVEFLFILYFLLSFIPQVRDYFKKTLGGFCILLGTLFLIISAIMTFYVYPKLLRLYQQTNMATEEIKWTTFLVIGFVIAISLIFYGAKNKKISKMSNTAFYLNFGTVLIAGIVFLELMIMSIILPIYDLTNNI